MATYRVPSNDDLAGKLGGQQQIAVAGSLTGTITDFQYDIDFVAGTARGGFQTYGNNNDDGRLLRDPSASSAVYIPTTAGGPLLSLTSATGLRRNTAGAHCYPSFGCPTDFLWNRDLTQAVWVKTNMTAAKDQTGAEGSANVASSLTATAGNATVLQATTQTVNTVFAHCRVKRITGSGVINMTVDGGTTWQPITVTASYARQHITQAGVTNPSVGFQIVTSGDAIAVDFVMLYPRANSIDLPVDSSVIISGTGVTFISQARPNIDKDDAGPLANVIRAGPWAWFMQFRTERGTVGGGALFTGDVTVQADILTSNARWYGVSTAGGLILNGLNSVNKVAGYLRGNGSMALCLNGGAVATGTGKTLATTLDHLDLMTNGASNLSNYGIIERFAMGPSLTFTDAQLQAMTT